MKNFKFLHRLEGVMKLTVWVACDERIPGKRCF